jgi:hypothetical protein
MLLTGFGCYTISFLRIDRREGERKNFAFFSTVAIAATLTGSAQILPSGAELALFLGASIVLAYFGARRLRSTLSLHAAIYVVAAGFTSGLVGKALDALTGSAAPAPSGGELLRMLLVIAVALICTGAPVVYAGKTWGRLSRMPKVVYLVFLAIVIDGLVAAFAADRFARLPGEEFDGGIVAAFRTGLLALTAVALGYFARWEKLREGARLVPVILVLGGLALALGDLRGGRPATQFASMALYGFALILAPRMARSARDSS